MQPWQVCDVALGHQLYVTDGEAESGSSQVSLNFVSTKSRAGAAVPETLTIKQLKPKSHQGVSSLLSPVLEWRKGPTHPDLSPLGISYKEQ